MKQRELSELVNLAKSITAKHVLGRNSTAGAVGCALITSAGNFYVGVNLDLPCGIGFCAEHGAVAQMITAKESQVRAIVAYYRKGKILPPCGRCRELLVQVNKKNLNTSVILGPKRAVKLSKLLPEHWEKKMA